MTRILSFALALALIGVALVVAGFMQAAWVAVHGGKFAGPGESPLALMGLALGGTAVIIICVSYAAAGMMRAFEK